MNMKTKLITIYLLVFGGMHFMATAQERQDGSGLADQQKAVVEIPDDPKFTPADIEMLMEAAKGAPKNAEQVVDERALPHEIPSDGIYYLAPADAEPVNEEEEHQRWLLDNQEMMNLSKILDAGSVQTEHEQTIPELQGPFEAVRINDGQSEQPHGEIPPYVPEETRPRPAEQPVGEKPLK
jgi:hypothetical protein